MKKRLTKFLSVLVCIGMFFASLSVSTVFADVKTDEWLDASQINIPSEYDFSFMAIGDTQIVTRYDANGLPKIYDYVINNVKSKKVKHVMGLGDITDADTDWEWKRVQPQIARMDGVVPYSIVRGNHDIYSTRDLTGTGKPSMLYQSRFDAIYGTDDSPYAKQYTYCYEYTGAGQETFKARNTVHFFSSEKRDYMVVALDYGPNDSIVNWVNDTISLYPNHNVIITTHGYLQADGTTLDKGESVYPSRDYKDANDGDKLWEKLISKHSNIVMVICGHMSCEDVLMVKRTGDNGNEVTQFLIDPQGMDTNPNGSGEGGKDYSKGMVATFYVNEETNKITVDWYSTVKGQYYREKNNYTFDINAIERQKRVVSFDANGGNGTMDSVEMELVKFDVPECSFTAPDRKHVFKGWSLAPNGEIITETTLKIATSTTLYAIWEEIVLPKNKVSVSGGTVTPLADVYEQWSVVTVKADEPKEGKRFTGWYGLNGITILEGNSSSMEITFEMPDKAVSISAMYEDILFNIKATAGANGKISKSGNILVKQGKDYTFTFTPNVGYKVKDVLVNGVSVGAVESYTFTGVKEDATISVEFEKIVVEQEPSDTPNDTPSDTPSVDKNESSSGCGSSADAGATTLLVTLSLALLMVLKRIKG